MPWEGSPGRWGQQDSTNSNSRPTPSKDRTGCHREPGAYPVPDQPIRTDYYADRDMAVLDQHRPVEVSKALHPSSYGSHTVTLHMPGPGRAITAYRGDCTCGASSGPCTTAGMVWGWEASHREDMREQAIAHQEANDRAWELFESMHGGA